MWTTCSPDPAHQPGERASRFRTLRAATIRPRAFLRCGRQRPLDRGRDPVDRRRRRLPAVHGPGVRDGLRASRGNPVGDRHPRKPGAGAALAGRTTRTPRNEAATTAIPRRTAVFPRDWNTNHTNGMNADRQRCGLGSRRVSRVHSVPRPVRRGPRRLRALVRAVREVRGSSSFQRHRRATAAGPGSVSVPSVWSVDNPSNGNAGPTAPLTSFAAPIIRAVRAAFGRLSVFLMSGRGGASRPRARRKPKFPCRSSKSPTKV